MTKSLGAMQIFCDKFGAENFYSLNCDKFGIVAQGKFNPKVISQLEEFEMTKDEFGYLIFTAIQTDFVIRIVFTN